MDLPIKVEGIIFSKEQDSFAFLLIKRTPDNGGFWQSLTEGMHDGETVEKCLRRGIKEELGLDEIIRITQRLWSFSWHSKSGDPYIDLVYGVMIPRNAEIKLNPFEHNAHKWCSLEEAMQTLGKENNRQAFQHFKEQVM